MISMTSRPLPSVEEILDQAVAVSVPMRTRFRGQSAREVMLFRGPLGWAEFGPFPEYGAGQASRWLAAGIEAAFTGLGAPVRTTIPVNATVPAVSARRVGQVLERYPNVEAVQAVKIKVAEPGQQIDDDVARVAAVRRALPDAGLRVDANGAWTISEAVEALARILDVTGGHLEYAEQPVAGVEPLARLRHQLHRAGAEVPIAADEAIRKTDDPLRVAQLGAADLIVVKAAPLGGVGNGLEIVRASGLDAVVSSALDTSVGLTSGLALAARLDALPYACGLGTVPLFETDLVDSPLIPERGVLQVPTAQTGQGEQIIAPAPNPELLHRHRAPQARQQWWRDRVRAAHRVLTAAEEEPRRTAGTGPPRH